MRKFLILLFLSVGLSQTTFTDEQLTLTEKKVKLVKPSWWENKWLYFGYGAVLSYAVTTLINQAGDVFNVFD